MEYKVTKLNRGEKPCREELYELFITQNLPIRVLCELYNRTEPIITKWLRSYNINKDRKTTAECSKNTCMQRYGAVSATGTAETQQKYKQTCLQLYGVDNAMKNSTIADKVKDTVLQRYGVENIMQYKGVAQRIKKSVCANAKKHIGSSRNKERTNQIYVYKCLGIQKTQAQEEIRVYLQELGFDFVKTRKVIAPFEIDLYNEDLKLGIEFNGVFWHSDQRMPNNYHQLKYKRCKELGIRLIQIWEWEWLNDRDKCKSILSCACGCCKRLYARMCDVQPITNVVYKKFLQQNSIHGYRPAKVLLGLYFKQELVQVMSFGNAYLSHSKYQWEVIRSSTKLFTTVVGGQSKLLKYFEKSYNPKSILFYVDVDKFTGASLQNMGFEFSHLSKPGYKLSDGVNVFHRNPSRNTLQKQQIKEGRLHKVYNAGTECYVKILDNFL